LRKEIKKPEIFPPALSLSFPVKGQKMVVKKILKIMVKNHLECTPETPKNYQPVLWY
jgi:hypothetical protein